jgi:hypothetical protein
VATKSCPIETKKKKEKKSTKTRHNKIDMLMKD